MFCFRATTCVGSKHSTRTTKIPIEEFLNAICTFFAIYMYARSALLLSSNHPVLWLANFSEDFIEKSNNMAYFGARTKPAKRYPYRWTVSRNVQSIETLHTFGSNERTSVEELMIKKHSHVALHKKESEVDPLCKSAGGQDDASGATTVVALSTCADGYISSRLWSKSTLHFRKKGSICFISSDCSGSVCSELCCIACGLQSTTCYINPNEKCAFAALRLDLTAHQVIDLSILFCWQLTKSYHNPIYWSHNPSSSPLRIFYLTIFWRPKSIWYT